MTLAHDFHAAHKARRERMLAAVPRTVPEERLTEAVSEIERLRAALATAEAQRDKARRAEHAARGRVASLSRALSELQAYASSRDLDQQSRCMEIVQEVCVKHGCTPIQIQSHQRGEWISRARQEVFYRLATETLMSLSRIGKFMLRDHTTILYGVAIHAQRNGLPWKPVGPGKHRITVDGRAR